MGLICPLLSCGKSKTMECDHACTFYHQIHRDGRCLFLQLIKSTDSIARDLASQAEEND